MLSFSLTFYPDPSPIVSPTALSSMNLAMAPQVHYSRSIVVSRLRYLTKPRVFNETASVVAPIKLVTCTAAYCGAGWNQEHYCIHYIIMCCIRNNIGRFIYLPSYFQAKQYFLSVCSCLVLVGVVIISSSVVVFLMHHAGWQRVYIWCWWVWPVRSRLN